MLLQRVPVTRVTCCYVL